MIYEQTTARKTCRMGVSSSWIENQGNIKQCIWESPAQLENPIPPWVYVRRITRSTLYEEAPFC